MKPQEQKSGDYWPVLTHLGAAAAGALLALLIRKQCSRTVHQLHPIHWPPTNDAEQEKQANSMHRFEAAASACAIRANLQTGKLLGLLGYSIKIQFTEKMPFPVLANMLLTWTWAYEKIIRDLVLLDRDIQRLGKAYQTHGLDRKSAFTKVESDNLPSQRNEGSDIEGQLSILKQQQIILKNFILSFEAKINHVHTLIKRDIASQGPLYYFALARFACINCNPTPNFSRCCFLYGLALKHSVAGSDDNHRIAHEAIIYAVSVGKLDYAIQVSESSFKEAHAWISLLKAVNEQSEERLRLAISQYQSSDESCFFPKRSETTEAAAFLDIFQKVLRDSGSNWKVDADELYRQVSASPTMAP